MSRSFECPYLGNESAVGRVCDGRPVTIEFDDGSIDLPQSATIHIDREISEQVCTVSEDRRGQESCYKQYTELTSRLS